MLGLGQVDKDLDNIRLRFVRLVEMDRIPASWGNKRVNETLAIQAKVRAYLKVEE